MPTTTHHSADAITYARSLLELASEKSPADAQNVAQELDALRQVMDANPTFALYLKDPGISEHERGEAIKRIFAPTLSPLVLQFLGVLNAHGRLGLLQDIPDAYNDLLEEQLGKIEVDVTVAQKLSPADLEQVRLRVGQALNKDAIVHQYVDESIIGGMVLRVQDKLIDASVKTQLRTLKEQLLAARPK